MKFFSFFFSNSFLYFLQYFCLLSNTVYHTAVLCSHCGQPGEESAVQRPGPTAAAGPRSVGLVFFFTYLILSYLILCHLIYPVVWLTVGAPL